MKYFVMFLGAIFALFVGLLIYGWSLPQTFVFEQSIPIKADSDEIYAEIDEMDRIRNWAPYVSGLGNDDRAITGAERGSGQLVNWRQSVVPFESGTQEVLAVTPPYFVQSRFSSAPYDGSIIYALNEGLPNEDVTVLVRLDLDAGSFPFFERIKLRRNQSAINQELTRALARLKTISES